MKQLILPFLFVVFTHLAHAQSNDWFKGNWDGVKSFTGARIGIRVLVRIEVDSVNRNRFSGRFIYMYPKDTIARLIKTFSGNIKGNSISLNKSKELYLLDPRSRSFWSNCSQCSETASLFLADSSLVFKIITTNCGDSCNGETIFSRDVYSYNPSMQAAIKQFFSEDKAEVAAKSGSKQKNKNSTAPKKTARDTIKKDQASMKVKQADNRADSIARAGKSANTHIVPSTDSLSKSKVNQEKTEISTISAKEKDKVPGNIATDTIKSNPPSKIANEGSLKNADSIAKIVTSTKVFPDEKTDLVPQAIVTRETELVNTFQVDSPHIQVDLFDNGEIDSDIVSVYYNGKLIVNHLTLNETAITFTIEASGADRHHEFILIAENEGSIPPNTALMRIKAGGKQYKLSVSTSATKNAKIAIDYLGY